MRLDFSVLPHQRKFLEDTSTRYLALVGGYGCGKSRSLVYKAIHLAFLNKGYRGVILEPTNAMVQDVLIPTFEEIVYDYKIPHKFRASPYPQYTLKFKGGETEILLRSGENYKRLAGLNLAFFGVDEIDTINKTIAVPMWRLLQSRLRSGKVFQGVSVSTPEGFNFLYDYFEKQGEGKTDRRLIRASTRDNPFLPPEFINDLLEQYPANLIEAYLDGKFVNLVGNRVYSNFDRQLNFTDKTLEQHPHHIVHIGQDFNIGNNTSVCHIIVDGIPYAVDEFKTNDTFETVKEIKSRYPSRKVIVYPDSSGKNRETNAVYSDLQIFENNNIEVKYKSKNPLVKLRVGAVNAMILNGRGHRRYFVNTNKCPTLTEALERQIYNKDGAPDKTSGYDHPPDAIGYFIWFNYPLEQHHQVTVY